MKRAKGPNSLHSPFSAPGLDSAPDVRFVGDVGIMVEMDAEDAAMYDNVGEKTISTISAGNEWAAGVGKNISSGDMILEWEADQPREAGRRVYRGK